MSDGFDIRLPNLTDGDEREQLRQIRSYLYQLAGQLQFALRGAAPVPDGASQTANGLSFALIKKQLLRSPEIAEAYGSMIRRQLEGAFLTERDLNGLAREFRTAHLTADEGNLGQLQMGEYCFRVDEAGHISLL